MHMTLKALMKTIHYISKQSWFFLWALLGSAMNVEVEVKISKAILMQ